jgi:hypothetical protein
VHEAIFRYFFLSHQSSSTWTQTLELRITSLWLYHCAIVFGLKWLSMSNDDNTK